MPVKKNDRVEEKTLLIRLPKTLHHEVRLLAYELNSTMAALCREGLQIVLRQHNKQSEKRKKS